MQGLVTLDFGNTNATAGIFSHGSEWELVKKVPLHELKIFLSQLGFSAHNTQFVLSDVKPREEELKTFVEEGYLITRVKDYWRGNKFHGMSVNYAVTLGEDRLITSFYAYKKMKVPTLILDAGTFVTMDVVTPAGFLGGFILPGQHTYFETFKKGENLKDVALSESTDHELPHSTNEAMARGYQAFAAMARELIQEHQIQKVLITGGDAPLWEKLLSQMKSPSVVETHPHLIHSSLLYWMTTQIEPL